MRKRTKPTVTRFTAEALEGLVARSEQLLPSEDHAQLVSLVDAFLLLGRMVREGRATLKRMRRLFGLSSSEKKRKVFSKGSGSDQSQTAGAQDSDTSTDPSQPKRGHGRRAASDYPEAEHIFLVHDTLSPGCSCPACERGSLYELKKTAPTLRIFGQPLLFAKCWDSQLLRCSSCLKVHTAPVPTEAFGPKYSESAASVLAVMRFGLGTPHYRLDRLQDAMGTPVSDATQWDVLRARAIDVYPAYQHLLHLAAQAPLIHTDDTHARVLEFMGKRREKLVEGGQLPRPDRTGLFTTGIVAIIPEGQLGLYITGRRHAGENLNAMLERRAKEIGPPLLMCDALEHNVPKDHPVVESNCLTHARRNVIDQAENFPDECKHVIDKIGIVYAVEAACSDEGLPPEARLWMHQQVSAPALDHLRAWMTAQFEEKRVEPNSTLGKAFNYMLKRWDKLTLFLHVPGAAIDNNICERLLKLPVLVRKNSLFFRSERGAVVGDVYMSLIRTTILHDQNPIDYLTTLMTHYQAVAESPAEWMPWNYRRTLAARTNSSETCDAGADVEPAEPTNSVPPVDTTTPDVEHPSSLIAQPAVPTALPPPVEHPDRAKPSRSCSKKQSAAAPPAFALSMLLCLVVPLLDGSHHLMANQAVMQDAASASAAERLAWPAMLRDCKHTILVVPAHASSAATLREPPHSLTWRPRRWTELNPRYPP